MDAVQALAVPNHIRQFILSNYGLNPDSHMFCFAHEINIIYVESNGIRYFLDLSSVDFSQTNQAIYTPRMYSGSHSIQYLPTYGTGYQGSSPGPQMPSEFPPPSKTESSVAPNQIDHYSFSCPRVSKVNSWQTLAVKAAELANSNPVMQEKLSVVERQLSHIIQQTETYDGCEPYAVAAYVTASTKESDSWLTMSDREREEFLRERRKASAYKTALCHAFKEKGSCPYGEQCRYAHGEHELRMPPQAHPKYKTQLCNKFSNLGICPYGARCQFVHKKAGESENDTISKAITTVNSNSKCDMLLSYDRRPTVQSNETSSSGGTRRNSKDYCGSTDSVTVTDENDFTMSSCSISDALSHLSLNNQMNQKNGCDSLKERNLIAPCKDPQHLSSLYENLVHQWSSLGKSDNFSHSCDARIPYSSK